MKWLRSPPIPGSTIGSVTDQEFGDRTRKRRRSYVECRVAGVQVVERSSSRKMPLPLVAMRQPAKTLWQALEWRASDEDTSVLVAVHHESNELKKD
jgi:hypothetical protein